jgi:hypothetical protein
MRPLWNCRELRLPGNILVVEETDGPDRVFVLENEASIAELSPDGKVSGIHPVPVEAGEPIRFLRQTESEDGAGWFVASAGGGPRLHLLDGGLKPVLEYPPRADEFTHAGIADIQFGDLDGDGTPEMCVGYWGDVGVQNVSLEGKRIWRNRTVAQVLRVAVLGLDAQGRRGVLCTNQVGSLVRIGADGKRLAETAVPGRPINWIVSDDLDGDGKMELCGLSPTDAGSHVALGLNLQGDTLWTHPLPPGMHAHAIEPIVAGRLLAGQPGQWLLPGADGSIHVVSASGQLVDQFNYGAALTGLATAEWDGRHVLLVATAEGVDAWQVELP